MRFLLDALRHYLQKTRRRTPLWGSFFDVENLIIESPRRASRRLKLEILRELVEGFESRDAAKQAAAIARITQQPAGP